MILAFPGVEDNFFNHTLFLQNLANALSNGAVYALMALTVVIIYKTTGHLNFAQGEMAMFSTFIIFVLNVEHRWNVWLSIVVVVALAMAFGAALERGLIQPLEKRSVLAPVILTLGLFFILNGLAAKIWSTQPRTPIPQPFPGQLDDKLDILDGPPKFFVTYKAIGVWITVAVLVTGVNLLLKRTKLGLAYRAVAANSESSLLVGIPVQRMLMFGWALAAGIGAIAGADHRAVPRRARLQLHGCHPPVRLRGRRAGRVRLDRRRGRRRAPRGAPGDVHPGLLHRHRQRAEPRHGPGGHPDRPLLQAERAVRLQAGRTGVTPRIIYRGSVEHRVWQVLGWLAILGVALYVIGPGQDYLVLRWAQAVTFAIAILGLNLVTGYSGQVSLGHSAFFGIGAYTSMILVADHGWPFLLTLPVAGAAGFAVGFVVGLPALRIRGLYLSLITLGIALAFPSIVKKFESLTGGSNGKTITVGKDGVPNGFSWRPPSWFPGHLAESEWVFLTVLAVAIVLFLLASNLVRSRIGRGTVAVRDNEIGAVSSGVYGAATKVMAFAISALWTAVGGGCFALAGGTIAPDSFGLQRSIEFIAGLVIGGVGTILGPAVGGVIVEFLPYLTFNVFPGPEAGVLYGVVLVVLVFFMPGGIIAGVRMIKARFIRFVPRLPTITVPSEAHDDATSAA